MKTVLVTGANGQLGQTINDLFLSNNDSVEFVFVSKSDLNIAHKNDVEQIFNTFKFDYCINCAAYTNVELAESAIDDTYRVNAEAPKILAEVCSAHDTVLIHISTDYVFNGENKNKYTEEDATDPINEYGKSKLLGEQNIQAQTDKYFIIRTSWLYSQFGKNFVKTIVQKIQENATLQITTSQVGTPTSCEHLAKFIYFLITSDQTSFGIYHFSAIGKATWYDFGLQIASHFSNYDVSLISPVDTFNSKAERPAFSILDNTKALAIYKRIFPWKVGVDEVMRQLKKL
jgi:dTDP-4-dehydrorhamnose reductase